MHTRARGMKIKLNKNWYQVREKIREEEII
jgi:hypothetical protein